MKKNHRYLINKKEMMRSFNKASQSYDQAALVQREITHRLMERLDLVKIKPKMILDLGAGTGYSTQLLENRYKKAKIVAVDMAENMLSAHRTKKWFDRKRYVCADAENLPFLDDSFDLIFSNLMLHWCNDVEKAIKEMYRVLKPEGMLFFTALGPDTMYELRDSWSKMDNEIHVHRFVDMYDIGDYLNRAQFADVVVDMEFLTVTYNELRKILCDLKDLGTYNLAAGRMKGLTGKERFRGFVQAYEQFRNADGLIPLTYEIIYGHAVGSKREERSPQEVSIPLSKIQRRPG